MSVVICTYTPDRWEDFERAVRSVVTQRQPVQEVVVVVDHNPELLDVVRARWSTPSVADEGGGPVVRVVANGGPRGLSGARNAGVAAAGSEIVAFLDDDAEADASWSQRLLAPYADDLVVACGGAVVANLAAPRPAWWPLEFNWVVGCSHPGLPADGGTVRNFIGANMSFRRAAILEVGGFDPARVRIHDETDLCIRLALHQPDTRAVYEPAAIVRHNVSAERLTWRYFRWRCYLEGTSKAQVARGVGSKRALSSEWSYSLRVLPRAVGRALVGALKGEKGAARRAIAIAAGLAMTTGGYLRGRLAPVRDPTERVNAFTDQSAEA